MALIEMFLAGAQGSGKTELARVIQHSIPLRDYIIPLDGHPQIDYVILIEGCSRIGHLESGWTLKKAQELALDFPYKTIVFIHDPD